MASNTDGEHQRQTTGIEKRGQHTECHAGRLECLVHAPVDSPGVLEGSLPSPAQQQPAEVELLAGTWVDPAHPPDRAMVTTLAWRPCACRRRPGEVRREGLVGDIARRDVADANQIRLVRPEIRLEHAGPRRGPVECLQLRRQHLPIRSLMDVNLRRGRVSGTALAGDRKQRQQRRAREHRTCLRPSRCSGRLWDGGFSSSSGTERSARRAE